MGTPIFGTPPSRFMIERIHKLQAQNLAILNPPKHPKTPETSESAAIVTWSLRMGPEKGTPYTLRLNPPRIGPLKWRGLVPDRALLQLRSDHVAGPGQRLQILLCGSRVGMLPLIPTGCP